MKRTYDLICEKLNEVNFGRIVEGFERISFALFDDDSAIYDGKIIGKPKEFMANSAVEYKGSWVATFYFDFLPKDIDIATSLIVHEMFHAFQFGMDSFQELVAQSDEKIGMLYNYSVESMTLKYNETMYLREAYQEASSGKLESFLSIRREREAKETAELLYEKITETIEGYATYVELMALRQLNDRLYAKRLEELMRDLEDINAYFAIRELSYKVGALLLLTFDKLEININDVTKGVCLLSDIMDHKCHEFEIKKNDEIQKSVEENIFKKKRLVEQFFMEPYREIDFDNIIGYNPMGAVRYENKLLIKYLMIIMKDGKERNLNGDFCLVLDQYKKFIKLYIGG